MKLATPVRVIRWARCVAETGRGRTRGAVAVQWADLVRFRGCPAAMNSKTVAEPALELIPTMNRPPKPTRVALVQMRCAADPEANVDRACELLRDAHHQGAQIACLPELFRSEYFCQTENHQFFELAEPIPGPTSDRLADVARATG